MAARATGHPPAPGTVGDACDSAGVGDQVEDVVKQMHRLQILTDTVVGVGEGQSRVHPSPP